jgi:hypothetical protein
MAEIGYADSEIDAFAAAGAVMVSGANGMT